jgi:hypothetical protein
MTPSDIPHPGGNDTLPAWTYQHAVLISVCAVVIAQFAFTYVPIMQEVFKTEPVSVRDGVLIVGIGVAVLISVEVEKRLLAALSQGKFEGRLLMLWTAPPPARKCQGCGCC